MLAMLLMFLLIIIIIMIIVFSLNLKKKLQGKQAMMMPKMLK